MTLPRDPHLSFHHEDVTPRPLSVDSKRNTAPDAGKFAQIMRIAKRVIEGVSLVLLLGTTSDTRGLDGEMMITITGDSGEDSCDIGLSADKREQVSGSCAVQVSYQGKVLFDLRLEQAVALLDPGNFEVELVEGAALAIKNAQAPQIVARRYSQDGQTAPIGAEPTSRIQAVAAELADIGMMWRNGNLVTIQNDQGGVFIETQIQEPGDINPQVIDNQTLSENDAWEDFDLSQIGINIPSLPDVKHGCSIRVRGGNTPEDRRAIALMVAAMLTLGLRRKTD